MALPLGELSPKVTERARMLTEKSRRSDSIALPKRQFIAARRGLGRRQRAFCAFLLKKLSEDTFYWTFILLYSCQNKKTQEGRGMKDIELRYVGGHVEVYTGAGAFLFSADTLRETNY